MAARNGQREEQRAEGRTGKGRNTAGRVVQRCARLKYLGARGEGSDAGGKDKARREEGKRAWERSAWQCKTLHVTRGRGGGSEST